MNAQFKSRPTRVILFVLFCGLLVFLHSYTNVLDIALHEFSGRKRSMSLSLHCNAGRLGNQMCTYATLYGLSVLNRRHFLALTCNTDLLTPFFSGLSAASSVTQHLFIKKYPYTIGSYLKAQDTIIPPYSNFVQGYLYPCSYTFFDHVQQQIRDIFRFNPKIENYARRILQKANAYQDHHTVYVGVHVRRGDYQKRWLDAFDGVAVNIAYFEKAFEHFRSRYVTVVFVVVSDDRLWCIKNLAQYGVYITEDAPTPSHDLAVLAHCNHTIMTYGTFGFWGAYLAGGDVVYFDKFLKPDTKFVHENFVFEKMYPPRWKGIVTLNDSYWNATTIRNNVTAS